MNGTATSSDADVPLVRVFERRSFMMMSLAAAAWGLAGCAGKKGRKSQEPESATEGLSKAFGAIKKRVRKHVAAKSKRGVLEKLLDEAEQSFLDVNRLMGDWRYSMAKLSPEERRDRDVLIRITEDYNAQIGDRVTHACRQAIDARQHITESEWALVWPEPETGKKKRKGA